MESPELAATSKTAKESGSAIKVIALTMNAPPRRTKSRLALGSRRRRYDGGSCYTDEFAYSSHLSASSSLYAPESVLSREC